MARKKKANGKWTKPPYRVSDRQKLAETNDLKTWGSYEDACRAVRDKQADGIGFCLLGSDICAIDVEQCTGFRIIGKTGMRDRVLPVFKLPQHGPMLASSSSEIARSSSSSAG